MPSITITQSTATSSSPGASTAAVLNWRANRPTTVLIYSTNANSSAFYQIQFTLDDIQTIGGTSVAFWAGLSSGYSDTGITLGTGSVFASSTQVLFSFDGPLAGVRLNSSAMLNGPVTLKVIESDGY